MPAELFPVAIAGAGLLLLAALLSTLGRGLIGWVLGLMLALLIGGQAVASATGLASGETEPAGWPWDSGDRVDCRLYAGARGDRHCRACRWCAISFVTAKRRRRCSAIGLAMVLRGKRWQKYFIAADADAPQGYALN